uniref:Lysozyme g n=1 Tax=Crocodylus porosus TaxID=8502 RepID=A0A7M4F1T9_CROPO
MSLTLIILGLAAFIDTSSQSGCYGNINRVGTTGASCQTARPEHLPYCGEYDSTFCLCVDPAVIAGIISRESHVGSFLKNGCGDEGHGFGLMQWAGPLGVPPTVCFPSSRTQILVNMIRTIQRKFPRWTKEQQLQSITVTTYAGMGIGTTHSDYDNDVIARAKFYKRNGY